MKFRKILLLGLLIVGLSLLPKSVYADVNNFYFESMTVDYKLSKDRENRAVLDVKEVLVAVFPDYDQNHGIERFIPLEYQEHSLNLKLGKVTLDGQSGIIAKQEDESGFRKLRLGRANEYLRGKHVFEINYRLHDVILEPKDNKSTQEFYWDVNGTGWSQKFEQVKTRLEIDQSLLGQLKSQQSCYTGIKGSNEQNCLISRTDFGYQAETTRALQYGENLTIAVAFDKETFIPYQKSWFDYLKLIGGLVATTASLVIPVWAVVWRKRFDKYKVKKAYPAQYLPPTDSDIYINSEMINSSRRVAAGLVDLAIRGNINIIESDKKEVFGSSKQYSIQLIKVHGLSADDSQFLTNFMSPLKLGAEHIFKKNDYKLGDKVRAYNSRLAMSMSNLGYINDFQSAQLLCLVAGILAIIWSFVSGSALVFIVNGLAIGYVLRQTLTQKGAELKTHLLGLKKYIKMSETERLAFAQSVETADRKALLGQDDKAKVVLYERLLPYAILFGLEKTWAKELEVLYQNSDYDSGWYHGASALAAADMVGSLNSFTNSVSSSASSSSSSSGSSGGGFSGGGGGGGGGGGW